MKVRLNRSLFFLFIAISINGNSQSKELTIGDKCPDVVLTRILNYKSSATNLFNFKNKLIILDFWATWCSPCIARFPKIDSLQKMYGNLIQILPVTSQDEKVVAPLIKNLKILKNVSLPIVVNDIELHKLFNPHFLPHYVWIDQDGIIQAITYAEDVNSKNIQELLKNRKISLRIKDKKKLDFNMNLGLFTGEQPNTNLKAEDYGIVYKNSNAVHSCIITKYIDGLPSYSNGGEFNGSIRKTNGNNNLATLIMVAYAPNGERALDFYAMNRIVLNVKDTLRYTHFFNKELKFGTVEYYNWAGENIYCYESLTSKKIDDETKKKIMQDDLKKAFGVTATREMRKQRVWELVRTSNVDKLESKGGEPEELVNDYMIHYRNREFSWLFIDFLLKKKTGLYIKDETGFPGKKRIDLDINAQLTDLKGLNKELSKYDLELVEKEAEVEMIVVKEINF